MTPGSTKTFLIQWSNRQISRCALNFEEGFALRLSCEVAEEFDFSIGCDTDLDSPVLDAILRLDWLWAT
jgi:hypothetical protein